VNEKKEQEITDDPTITTATEEVAPTNNSNLNIDELIARIDLLGKNKNPYSVSKEIEEIKSLFYLKLKADTKGQEDAPCQKRLAC